MANPTLLTQPFAANGDKNVIPNTTATQGAFSQDKGFPAECSLPLGAGGVAPSRQDMNGAFNMLSNLMYYAQKGYIWHWEATQEYFVDCVVVDDTDGKMYRCISNVSAGGSAPSADTTHWDEFSLGGDGFAVGDIKWSSADLTQVGFVVANGAEVGRATYPDLNEEYAKKGYPWGDGDGSTTFNLPNLIGKFAEGATSAGGYHEAGLPNIEGSLGAKTPNIEVSNSGALSSSRTSTLAEWTQNTSANVSYNYGIMLDASDSNAIYGNSDTVQPNSALLVPYVKAFKGASADSTDVAITNVANDVVRIEANKANRDLSNLTDVGKKQAFAGAFISNTFVSLTNADFPYTAPANGMIVIQPIVNSSNWSANTITINGECILRNWVLSGQYEILNANVKKGDVISVPTLTSAKFFYAEGEV